MKMIVQILVISSFLVLGVSCKQADLPGQAPLQPIVGNGDNGGLDLSEYPQLSKSEKRGLYPEYPEQSVLAGNLWPAFKKLRQLSEKYGQNTLGRQLDQILQGYVQASLARVSVKSEVLFPLAIDENKQELQGEIDAVVAEIDKTERVLTTQWIGKALVEKHFGAATSIAEIQPKVMSFLNQLPSEFDRMGVDKRISSAIVSELVSRMVPVLDGAGPILSKMARGRSLQGNLESVRQILPYLVEEMPETVARIEKDLVRGDKLAKQISEVNGSHDLFRLIIDLWLDMTPKEREEIVKPQSPTLYGYLNAMSPQGFKCLKQALCNPIPPTPGVLLALATKRFILARIGLAGYEKILADIDTSAGDYVVESIEQQFQAELPEALDTARGLIIEGLVAKKAQLQELFRNNWAQLKDELRNYLENKVLGGQVLLNWPISKVVVGPKGIRSQSEVQDSGAATVASFMGALQSGWSTKSDQHLRRDFVSLVNWSIYMAGLAHNRQAQSLPRSYKGDVDSSYRLDKYFENSESVYGLPSNFVSLAQNSFDSTEELRFLAYDQWLLLENLLDVASHLQDWEESRFDQLFSRFTLNDFNSEVGGDSGRRKLFPKEQFFLLFLGLSGQVLDNALRNPSHFVLVDINDKDRSLADGDYDNVVMSYVVDYENGQRLPGISVAGAAQAIIAIDKFKKFAADIHKTKIAYLIDNKDGPSVVEKIQKARTDLTDLQRALSVFLSRYGFDEEGQVCNTLSREWECLEPAKKHTTTALVIEALALGYEVTEVSLFRARLQVALGHWLRQLQFTENGFAYVGEDSGLEFANIEAAISLLKLTDQFPWMVRQNKSFEQFRQNLWQWLPAAITSH